MTLTDQEKKRIETIAIALLLIAMIVLIFISISVSNKYNDLVIEHNKVLEINNDWQKICPQLNEEDIQNGNKFIIPSGFKI